MKNIRATRNDLQEQTVKTGNFNRKGQFCQEFRLICCFAQTACPPCKTPLRVGELQGPLFQGLTWKSLGTLCMCAAAAWQWR